MRLARFAMRWRQPVAFAAVTMLAFTGSLAWGAETKAPESLAAATPPGAIAYVQLNGLAEHLERLQNSEYLNQILAHPGVQAAQKSPQYLKFDAGRKIVEQQVGVDLWTAGKKLFGRQVAVALYPKPDSKEFDGIALIRVADPECLAQVRDRVETFLVLFASEATDRSEQVEGKTIVAVQNKIFYAVDGDLLAVASRKELLTNAIGLWSGKGGPSLAKDDDFGAVTRQMGDDQLLLGYVSTKAIAKVAGKRMIPQKLDNAVASLLFGGAMELTAHSPGAGLSLQVGSDRVSLRLGIAGNPSKLGEVYQSFFASAGENGVAPIPYPAGAIAGFTIHRDFTDWYRQREQLLQEQILPGFDKFESGLANLLPGKNFGEDILPLVGKNLTFVVAPQDYSYLEGEPGVKLPGFALIADLSKPKEGGDIFQLLFQTVVAIINLQVGQQGGEPMIMTGEEHNGVPITYSRHLNRPTGKELPLVLNFTPASARVADKFVMSSSVSLCRSLVDQLKQAPAPNGKSAAKEAAAKIDPATKETSVGAKPKRDLVLELYPAALADILGKNQELLKARMIQGGKKPEQASQEFETILTLLRYFKSAQMVWESGSDGLEFQLEVNW